MRQRDPRDEGQDSCVERDLEDRITKWPTQSAQEKGFGTTDGGRARFWRSALAEVAGTSKPLRALVSSSVKWGGNNRAFTRWS